MAAAGLTRRPVVGVTSSRGRGRYMWWFYWLALRLAGVRAVRLVAPVADLDPGRFDGLVIGGGDDIGFELQGTEPVLDVRIDPERDAMELALLRHMTDRNMPVLGICRGAQMLNLYAGGSLHQDIFERFADMPRMWTPLPRKTVTLNDGTRVLAAMRQRRVRVNSLHRQAIDRLGEGLSVTGRDQFGVIQAIEDSQAPFRVGVQWHPEFLIYKRPHRRLFRAFVAAVRRRVRHAE
ncbi:gamma-glutamyl-gamma-aminobutyrate hydrolase family protein [Futiania mangrovi]|uniref:Type 1 glutamine amidotransferase n=1 Tax=Futiania mangrovi TaxID=2959716 RepID=A0A9J6PKM7_9PROT|nr:type 1 glutamine amidotransferase [Futiania mangrovii]MCP1337135.1 type 1 glutamine amidotransferase [Futiania mangrovii]